MIVFHIDVNSAYLSWEAVYRLQHGAKLDLRSIPSAIGGNEENRHGIVLAKSIPAKKFGVRTGEPLVQARRKCPNLVTIPPRYSLYMKASNALYNILLEYSPKVQRFSVDECFLDFTPSQHNWSSPKAAANHLRERIKQELGFTVNIGVSSNKLLAKMASDFKKPNSVHTLFRDEIQKKMWPLPVSDLYMVGNATTRKLLKIGIITIGDLANTDKDLLRAHLKSHGELVWKYANGYENTAVHSDDHLPYKGVGNGTTISYDVTDRSEAHMVLLSLVEKVGMRLRKSEHVASVVSVSIKTSSLIRYSHQGTLKAATDVTNEIYNQACKLFDQAWQGEPIRHLRVRLSGLKPKHLNQRIIFGAKEKEKMQKLDKAVDKLREQYGDKVLQRGVFINSKMAPTAGGVGEEDYKMMTSIL